MKDSKNNIIYFIRSSGLIPSYYHQEVEVLLQLIRISYRCGIRVFEFMHQRDNKGLRIFGYLANHLQDFPGLVLGAGTVLDKVMAERYLRAGASFISSPFLQSDVAETCRRYDALWIPGCTSSEEIDIAQLYGAEIVTIVPGNILGYSFVEEQKKIFPKLDFIPSGVDVNQNQLANWFDAGSIGIKSGVQFFSKDALIRKDWHAAEMNVFTTLKKISTLKTSRKPITVL